MLGCCRFLCSKEHDDLERLIACYPKNDRPEPVQAKVRELISYCNHDIQRYSSINELLFARIHEHMKVNLLNRVSVGFGIYIKLIPEARELSLNLSTNMCRTIINCAEKEVVELIKISSNATISLLRHFKGNLMSNQITCSIMNVFDSFAELAKNEKLTGTVIDTIASMLNECGTIVVVPVSKMMNLVYLHYQDNSQSSEIIRYMTRVVDPLTLQYFTDSVFSFLDSKGDGQTSKWDDVTFVNFIMNLFFIELRRDCIPALFRNWISLLKFTTEYNVKNIICEISAREISDSISLKSCSQSFTDNLPTLYTFMLNECVNKKSQKLINNCINIMKSIVSSIQVENIQLLYFSYQQIWQFISSPNDMNNIKKEHIETLFRIAIEFTKASKNIITNTTIESGLEYIQSYIYTSKSARKAYSYLLEYIVDLSNLINQIRLDSVLEFLLNLQDIADKRKNTSLHTFVMCCMDEISKPGPENLREYVETVIKARMKTKPVEIDTTLSFVTKKYPELKSAKSFASKVKNLFIRKKLEKCITNVRKSKLRNCSSPNEVSQNDEYSKKEKKTGPGFSLADKDLEESQIDDVAVSSLDETVKMKKRGYKSKKEFDNFVDNLEFDIENVKPIVKI